MGILAGLKKYAEGYKPIKEEFFSDEEIAAIKEAKVVNSNYGLSVCLFLVGGGQSYIPVGRDALPYAEVGQIVDLRKAKVVDLQQGDSIIQRIEF